MNSILKTFGTIALAGIMAFSAVSCGKGGSDGSSASSGTVSSSTASAGGENSAGNNISGDAIGLLNEIWNSYGEAEKFHVTGGDESHVNFEGPGEYSVENEEMLDGVLGFPAELADKIDSAASLSHAMNTNTFTCGAFHFKNEEDAEAAVSKIKENIIARQWICGFPDSMMIISVPGNYIIALWGIEEGTGIVSTFKNKVLSTIEGAMVVEHEPIV